MRWWILAVAMAGCGGGDGIAARSCRFDFSPAFRGQCVTVSRLSDPGFVAYSERFSFLAGPDGTRETRLDHVELTVGSCSSWIGTLRIESSGDIWTARIKGQCLDGGAPLLGAIEVR